MQVIPATGVCVWLQCVVLWMWSHQKRSMQWAATQKRLIKPRAMVQPKDTRKDPPIPQTPQHFPWHLFITSGADLRELSPPKYCWPDFNDVRAQCTIKPSTGNNMDKCGPKSAHFRLKHTQMDTSTHKHSQPTSWCSESITWLIKYREIS